MDGQRRGPVEAAGQGQREAAPACRLRHLQPVPPRGWPALPHDLPVGTHRLMKTIKTIAICKAGCSSLHAMNRCIRGMHVPQLNHPVILCSRQVLQGSRQQAHVHLAATFLISHSFATPSTGPPSLCPATHDSPFPMPCLTYHLKPPLVNLAVTTRARLASSQTAVMFFHGDFSFWIFTLKLNLPAS